MGKRFLPVKTIECDGYEEGTILFINVDKVICFGPLMDRSGSWVSFENSLYGEKMRGDVVCTDKCYAEILDFIGGADYEH